MFTAVRLPDWEARIVAYLEPLHTGLFAWGSHDCCTFTAGAIEAMTGVDPMPEFRGAYTTEFGSARALKTRGAGDLPTTLDTKFARVAVPLAHRGDIVMSGGGLGLIWTHQRHTVAIMVGAEGARDGLVRFDRAEWRDPIVWRVPHP